MPEGATAETVGPRRRPTVLWVSTSPSTRGGVASFVSMMQQTDFWTRWRVRHVTTHCDGSARQRIATYGRALPVFLHEALRRRPALVHVHMSSYGSFFRKSVVVWLCALLRIRVVLQVHGAEFHQFHAASPAPLRWFIRATVESATVVVALGGVWQRRLLAVAPKATVVVVPNSVHPVGPAVQPAPGEPVHVLFLGRVGQRKGVFELLDGWAAAFGDGASARLTVAGDGEVERARRLVAERGLGRSVDILGWVSARDVSGLLARSQVLVLPSHNEGQPMAVLEAMAHGLCVVATDTGGIPDLIDHRSGVLVPVGDTAALVAGLTRVVTDAKERISLGDQALKRVRDEFDVAVVSQRLDDLYRSVLAVR